MEQLPNSTWGDSALINKLTGTSLNGKCVLEKNFSLLVVIKSDPRGAELPQEGSGAAGGADPITAPASAALFASPESRNRFYPALRDSCKSFRSTGRFQFFGVA